MKQSKSNIQNSIIPIETSHKLLGSMIGFNIYDYSDFQQKSREYRLKKNTVAPNEWVTHKMRHMYNSIGKISFEINV